MCFYPHRAHFSSRLNSKYATKHRRSLSNPQRAVGQPIARSGLATNRVPPLPNPRAPATVNDGAAGQHVCAAGLAGALPSQYLAGMSTTLHIVHQTHRAPASPQANVALFTEENHSIALGAVPAFAPPLAGRFCPSLHLQRRPLARLVQHSLGTLQHSFKLSSTAHTAPVHLPTRTADEQGPKNVSYSPTGVLGPTASRAGVPHTATRALWWMTHFPPFPPQKKRRVLELMDLLFWVSYAQCIHSCWLTQSHQ